MSNIQEKPEFDVNASCRKHATSTSAVTAKVDQSDHIFNWLLTNPVFDSRDSAVSYYFHDGKKSAYNVKRLLDRYQVQTPRPSLLEFASGYGCVSRHMLNAMPNLDLTSCDIHAEAIEFLRANIPGSSQLQSKHKPEDFNPDRKYDYVFALSFFSHMPRRTWPIWLQQLFAAVKSGGYLMFTTQGETSRQYHGNPTIPEDGFWFSEESEQRDLDLNEYGQTIVTPTYAVSEIAKIADARLIGLDLHGWWEHQDLYVVRKER